ncbi:MAG: methyltransferase, partial [Ornithinimicrobium sp.]
GTGSGVQALHLGGHSAYRVVSDLSERALAFATFTCALNGVEVDARQGSLFDPVAGETFDLIVCNPPFVITPRDAGLDILDYRDGGAVGDGLVAEVVSRIGDHLSPGGIGQLLGNWELMAGQDWSERVEQWLPTDLDAWVIQREEQDISDYAMTWARDAGHSVGTPGFDRWYAAWLDDFAARGIERVGFGVITLQRPAEARKPWRALEGVRHGVASPMGPTVLAGLRARNWLAMHDDAEVLAVPWSVASDVTEERIGPPGAPDPMVIQLRQGGGLRRVVQLDSLSAGLVGALDGDMTAAQIVQALAALTDTAAGEVASVVSPIVRTLVADGLLH